MKAKARKAKKPAARKASRGTVGLERMLVEVLSGQTVIDITLDKLRELFAQNLWPGLKDIQTLIGQLNLDVGAAFDARQERGRLLEQVRRLIAEKQELIERISKLSGSRMRAQAAQGATPAHLMGDVVPYGEYRALQAYCFELESQLDALTAPKDGQALENTANLWPRQNGQQNPAQR